MTPPPPASAPSPASPFDAAGLAGHVAWVKRLARALVRDAAAAEDVAQETWRVTLEQPAGRVGGGMQLKAWLRGVARRLALDRARSEASRARRERLAAADTTAGSPCGGSEPHEIVERGARQHRVVAAVMRLPEPLRSTVLYRYLDELSTRDVAARMQCSEEAVRKRLERGLALLRRDLDAEFGAPTRQWAGLLLAGPGVVAMTAKAKVVAAAAVLAAAIGGIVIWPEFARREAAAPERAAPERVAATFDAGAAPEAMRAEVVPTGRDEALPAPAPAASGDDVTLVRVRVVAADGTVQREGSLAGGWSEIPTGGRPPPLRHFAEPIAGETTELVFPAACAALVISASVAGHPASAPLSITKLRTEPDPAARRGRVERDVTLELAAGLPVAALSGRVLVDGVPRVPRGFAVDVVAGEASDPAARDPELRVHAVEARYEFRPAPREGEKLWVTSDETCPQLVEPDLDEPPQTLDLELSSARELRLTLLDRSSGSPLRGFEVLVDVSLPTERGFLRQTWRNHARFARADLQGVAVVRGLPERGTLDVRRDGSMEEREVPLRGGGSMRALHPKEPLLRLELDPESPVVLERTLVIDVARPLRRIHGRLRPEWLAPRFEGEPRVDLWWAKVEPEGSDRRRTHREDSPIVRDEQGAWSLAAQPDRSYLIWAERERQRISEVVRVDVADDDVGPIEIPPRRGSEVVLRFLRCPPGGVIGLSVEDRGSVTPLGVSIPVHGGTLERRVVLDGPARVSVSWEPDVRSESGLRTTRLVDPATTPVAEFDLSAGEARPVELELSSGSLPPRSRLYFARIGGDGRVVEGVAAQVDLHAGRSEDPLALTPGRWLYHLYGTFRGVVAGVVTIEPGPADRPIAIRCELAPRPADEAARGVVVGTIGGVEVPAYLRPALRWRPDPADPSSDAPILVPTDAGLVPIGE